MVEQGSLVSQAFAGWPYGDMVYSLNKFPVWTSEQGQKEWVRFQHGEMGKGYSRQKEHPE